MFTYFTIAVLSEPPFVLTAVVEPASTERSADPRSLLTVVTHATWLPVKEKPAVFLATVAYLTDPPYAPAKLSVDQPLEYVIAPLSS